MSNKIFRHDNSSDRNGKHPDDKRFVSSAEEIYWSTKLNKGIKGIIQLNIEDFYQFYGEGTVGAMPKRLAFWAKSHSFDSCTEQIFVPCLGIFLCKIYACKLYSQYKSRECKHGFYLIKRALRLSE